MGITAAHTGFEQIVTIMFSGDLQQFGTVLGYQLLVGGADALAPFQSLLRELISGSDTAHGLTDNGHTVVM